MRTNSAKTPRLIRKHCELSGECAGLLEQAMSNNIFSARAHDRMLEVARTLADPDGGADITGNHILEAINHTPLDRALSLSRIID